jgi:hypothetical protein
MTYCLSPLCWRILVTAQLQRDFKVVGGEVVEVLHPAWHRVPAHQAEILKVLQVAAPVLSSILQLNTMKPNMETYFHMWYQYPRAYFYLFLLSVYGFMYFYWSIHYCLEVAWRFSSPIRLELGAGYRSL